MIFLSAFKVNASSISENIFLMCSFAKIIFQIINHNLPDKAK